VNDNKYLDCNGTVVPIRLFTDLKDIVDRRSITA